MEEGADTQQQSRRGGGGGGKSKGRGRHASMDDERYSGRDGVFESLDNESGTGPARCKWFGVCIEKRLRTSCVSCGRLAWFLWSSPLVDCAIFD
jgi:hypothetical protein